MEYSQHAFKFLSGSLDGNQTMRSRLLEMNKELVAFADALNGNDQAHQWLYEQGYYELSTLVQACNKNVEALKWLLSKKKEYAAVAGAANGHDESYIWLANNRYHELAYLADQIKKIL